MLILDVKTRCFSTHHLVRAVVACRFSIMSKDSELREHELTPDEWNALVMVTSWLKVFRSATATTQTSATKHPLLSTTSTIFRGLWQQIKRGMRPRKACPRSPCQRRRRGLSFQRSHVRKLAGKLDPQKYGAYALYLNTWRDKIATVAVKRGVTCPTDP
ncbi:hypothetical protein DFH06DRAFT_259323 [Mycena polygramma]|nr:hypothetical protein DFH06DRAFT_259323 [Mycena polygramma]